MPPQENKFAPIFKSLQTERSASDAPITAAVSDVEQRWPLFNAVAPAKPETPPALTDVDRQNWHSPDKSGQHDAKPVLTEPSLSDKLAHGLSKMGGARSAGHQRTPAKTAKTPKPEPGVSAGITSASGFQHGKKQEAPPPQADAIVPSTNTSQSHSVKPARPAQPPILSAVAASVTQADLPQQPAQAVRPDVSNTPAIKPVLPSADDSRPAQPQESLKSLFSRLEHPEPPRPKPIIHKSSFLSRLGRR